MDEPFVDGLSGVCHENAAFEVGLAEDIGEGGRVVNVETIDQHRLAIRYNWKWSPKVHNV